MNLAGIHRGRGNMRWTALPLHSSVRQNSFLLHSCPCRGQLGPEVKHQLSWGCMRVETRNGPVLLSVTGSAGATACMGQLLYARLGKSGSLGSRQVCLTATALAGTAQADTDLRRYGTVQLVTLRFALVWLCFTVRRFSPDKAGKPEKTAIWRC